MMDLITVREIYTVPEKSILDKEIQIGGWVRSVRDSKTLWLHRCERRKLL